MPRAPAASRDQAHVQWRPHETVAIFVTILLFLFQVGFASRLRAVTVEYEWTGLTMLGLVLAPLVSSRLPPRLGEGVRLVPLIVWTYSFHRGCGVLLDELGVTTYEARLSFLDHQLFGDDLSRILANVQRPWLTEVLQIAYSSFYELILIPLIVFVVTKRRRALAEVAMLIALGHAVVVFCNVCVPACWPSLLHEVPALSKLIAYDKPLVGLKFTGMLRKAISEGTRMRWDTFPSGHTCFSVSMLLLLYRHHKRMFAIFLPLGTAIVISTVYLRYHYGVDVIVGLILAVLLVRLIPGLLDELQKRRARKAEKAS